MTLYEIKHRFTGKVLFSLETTSLKLAVEAAVEAGAYLGSAYLRGANLADANLGSAYLGSAYLRGAYLGSAYLRGANLADANLGSAYLRGANLADAYLADANLAGAYLADANLAGAKIKENITIKRIPIQILGPHWDIIIWDEHMQIGCELHSLAEWFDFDDARINHMDRGALKFWRQWREPLMQICITDKRYQPKDKPEVA